MQISIINEDTELQYRLFLKGNKRFLIDGQIIQHLAGGSNDMNNDFDRYSSFSVIRCYIFNILYFLINGKNGIKLLTILTLYNPYHINKTYKFIKLILLLNT
jgi:GT2 family glycosyltransferase